MTNFDLMHWSEHKKVVDVLEYECTFCHRTYYEYDWNVITYFKHIHSEESTNSAHAGGLDQRCQMNVVNSLEYKCAF